VAQLRQQTGRIEHAISALVGLDSQPARRGRPPRRSQAKSAQVKKGHLMSPVLRKNLWSNKINIELVPNKHQIGMV
jgi:hypothetical protein